MKEWKQQNTFVIAVECGIVRQKKETVPIKSTKIIKAMTFNKSTGKLEELNVKKLYRFGEGYY